MDKNKELIYQNVLQEDIYGVVSNLETWDDCGTLVFKGFHYFTYHSIRYSSLYSQKNQKEPIYFIAYIGNKLVGILKLGHYVRSNYDFWGVNYVDIHNEYRQQGIATFLYEKLNEWCKNQDIVIVGSMLSKEGEKAKVHDLRKRILTNVKTYDDEQELYQELRTQNV